MEKLKNFFYNKNDLIVALIILLIAGVTIFVNVRSLLEYPKTISAESKPATTKTIKST